MPTIRKRGDSYQAQVRLKQGGVIVLEQSATFQTKRLAETWAYALEDNFRKGKHRSQSEKTVADAVRHHRDSLEKADKDIRGFSNSMNALIDSELGEKPIERVQAADIVAFGKVYAVGRSPATVLHALMTLSTCYATARNEMRLKPDMQEVSDAIKHLGRLGLAGKSIERTRRVTDEEIDRICKHHESLGGTTIPLRILLNLAIALPRRSGELFGKMLWKDYDGETIKLWDTKDPKKPRNEVVPVPPKARLILDALPKTADEICPYNSRSVSAAVYKACKVLDIDDLHLHDLRHEGVSRLFEAGLDIPRVSMISGHKSWATLRRYTHLKPSDVVQLLTK